MNEIEVKPVKTKVINLYGGSGLGKTTTAWCLAGEMKLRGYHVEYVSEYVKKWANQKRKPKPLDQFYIAAKQAHSESELYGKIDYIVTDSPVLLSGFYENYHLNRAMVLPAVENFLEYSTELYGVERVNFFLSRNKPFDPRGRYETAEQAKDIDVLLKQWLIDKGQQFIEVTVPDRQRVETILEYLNASS